MIRTNAVKLTSIKAYAYRQKQKAGDISVIIIRPDCQQPGIAGISRKTGEAAPTVNTNTKLFPLEAFQEAMELTRGLPFRRQGSIKVTEDMFVEPVEEAEEEPAVLNEAAYQKVVDRYTDNNGKLAPQLANREFISFARRSSIVRSMIQSGTSAREISTYIISNKIRNIADNHDLNDQEIEKIVEMLDDAYTRSFFKELNDEIRKLLARQKR